MGGTGLIGSQLVHTLRAAGHEVVAASLSSGVCAGTRPPAAGRRWTPTAVRRRSGRPR
ncbi:NAD-dependent epimerase/dehydratase family protein [Streptomyces sp. NPDC048551]|uniref:NAD-dependent epimerase/dehydratase family protein n=1 Tax=Streptomyces sp. NPDC048551 TaxID=3155758 RepID=UPI00343CAFB4